jgi:hypothetical protein
LSASILRRLADVISDTDKGKRSLRARKFASGKPALHIKLKKKLKANKDLILKANKDLILFPKRFATISLSSHTILSGH